MISFVRSNANGVVGFLADDRRTNVALTRARRHLALIGDSETLQNHSFLAALVDYCNENAVVHSAVEVVLDNEEWRSKTPLTAPVVAGSTAKQGPNKSTAKNQATKESQRKRQQKKVQAKNSSAKQSESKEEREARKKREAEDSQREMDLERVRLAELIEKFANSSDKRTRFARFIDFSRTACRSRTG